MANVTLFAPHTREQTEAIIDAALDITNERTSDPVTWPHIFVQACALLGARVPVVEQAPATGLALDGFLHPSSQGRR